jgi:hypothetical protein
MRTRRFFLFALIGAFLAVVLHVSSLNQFSRSVSARARSITVAEPERSAIRDDALWHSFTGHTAMYCGLALAVSSLVTVIISARRHEPAIRSVVFGLLLCYFLLQFVLV